jgi:small subunit ribosomal protein S13
MVRVAGIDIPNGKRIEISLRHIHGVGPKIARRIIQQVGIEDNPRTSDLSDEQISRIRETIDKQYTVESDLRREVNSNIRRLIDIGTYRGLRHRRGLPAHGQRTRTNARTKRGARRTVAGRRRTVGKK